MKVVDGSRLGDFGYTPPGKRRHPVAGPLQELTTMHAPLRPTQIHQNRLSRKVPAGRKTPAGILAALLIVSACGAPPPETANTPEPVQQTAAPIDATPVDPSPVEASPTIAEARAEPEAATPAPAPKAEASPAPEAPAKSTARAAVRAKRHMISTANPLAAAAGLDMLRRGGSAIDAAIAAQMVLNLVEPQSSGIGGGGFLMHYDAKSGDIDAYDGRETAPASSHPKMFLHPDGSRMKFFEAVVGGLSVGVPGLLRMFEDSHKTHGKLPWRDLFAPAIKLAEDGFAVSPRLNALITKDKYLNSFGSTAAYFYDDAKQPLAVGTTLKNPALADTLRQIATGGANVFYSGPIARDIVRAVQSAGLNPGGLREADMAGYRAIKRAPVCMPYRVWLICGMPPPSSGGISTLQILGILQGFDLAALKPDSADAAHLIAEAGRLAFADRNTYIADPEFIPVPTAGMVDPFYLEYRGKSLSMDGSLGKADPGMPDGNVLLDLAPDGSPKGVSTTHLSIIDSDGNAVSMTTSIETAFGSRLMVRGFLLNNQLTDFSFRPDRDGALIANRAAAGKRPRSSMAPTLVFDTRGRIVMAIGSPGGSRIIGYVAQTLIGALDWKLDMQAAIDLPHVVNRNGPTDLEKDTAAEGLREALEGRGHKVRVRDMTSGLHGIRATNDGLEGGADHRREGVVLGD